MTQQQLTPGGQNVNYEIFSWRPLPQLRRRRDSAGRRHLAAVYATTKLRRSKTSWRPFPQLRRDSAKSPSPRPNCRSLLSWWQLGGGRPHSSATGTGPVHLHRRHRACSSAPQALGLFIYTSGSTTTTRVGQEESFPVHMLCDMCPACEFC